MLRRLFANAVNHLYAFKFRYDLAAQVIRKHPEGSIENELAQSYIDLKNRHNNLLQDYVTMMSESSRLEAENNFMIKIINERDHD